MRRPAAGVLARADGGDAPPGRLGEDVRPAARAGLGRRGARALPADGHRRRAGCLLAAHGRLPGSEPPRIRAGRRRPPRRLPHLHQHARHRDRRAPRPGAARPHRPRRHRGRRRRQRRRHVRRRDRPARRRPHPRDPVRARVPDHAAAGPAAGRPPAHDARPRPPDLLPRGGRRAGDGRLRAQLRAVVPARRPGCDPARLQRPPARGGLGSLRGDRGQRAQAGPGDGGRPRDAADQRPGGLHARRRVLSRGDRRARALRRRGLLRARTGGRRRRRPGAGRVDPRGRALARPVADGHPALRRALPLAALRPGSRPRGLRELLRHQVPRTTSARPAARCARRRPTRGTSSTAPRSARSPAGSGSTGTRPTPPRATRRCVRAAGRAGTGRPRSAPSTGPAARRSRCSTRPRSPSSRSPGRARGSSWSACAPTASRARSGR